MTWPLGIAKRIIIFLFFDRWRGWLFFFLLELISVRKLDLRVRHRGQVESSKIDRRVLDISITYTYICGYTYIYIYLHNWYIYIVQCLFSAQRHQALPSFLVFHEKFSEMRSLYSFRYSRNSENWHIFCKNISLANIEYTIRHVRDSKKKKNK